MQSAKTSMSNADVPQSGENQKHSVHVPNAVWGPSAVALLVAIPGVAGYLLGQPWLFPGLGPTAFMQAESPHLPSARFYNVVMGHLLGMIAGFIAVALFDASSEPSVPFSHILSAPRLGAALVAVTLTVLGTALFHASHPPAATTALLITLGAMQATATTAGVICVGVLIVAAAGEALRQLRLRLLTA